MNKFFKKAVSSVLIIVLLIGSVKPTIAYSKDNTMGNIADCVIAASNKIMFTECSAAIEGSMAAPEVTVNQYGFHGSENIITVSGFCNSDNNDEHIHASVEPNKNTYDIKDIEQRIGNVKYDDLYSSDIVEDTSIHVDKNIYAESNIIFDNVSFSGSGYVTSHGDMDLYLNTNSSPEDFVSFYSENGSIYISGSRLTLNGMLYAPNGNICFDVKNLTINGCVYANNIYFNGTNLTVIRNERAQNTAVEKLEVHAQAQETAYIGETVAIHGKSNYENASYNWFCDIEGTEIRNAGAADTEVVFSEAGKYTVDLTGTYNGMTAEDHVIITVLPTVKKTYTSDTDFAEGEFTDTYTAGGSLKLSENDSAAAPINNEYEIGSNTGIKVKESISKDRLSAPADSVDIDYTFEIPERINDPGSDNQITGTDFVFVYDTSSSMKDAWSSVETGISELIGLLRMGDRIAICNLDNNVSELSIQADIENLEKSKKISMFPFREDAVSDEAAFEKMKTDAIKVIKDKLLAEKARSAVEGISNALRLFDRLYGDSYPTDRKRVILYFGDTQKSGTESSYKSKINSLGQRVKSNNIIFNAIIYEDSKKITRSTIYKCIQDIAIDTHGVYLTSGNISENILKVGSMNLQNHIETLYFETTVYDERLSA